MALTAPNDDRGQILLVSAIGLAILLTALALTLNTAVFAGIHAAEADDTRNAERGAIQYQHSAERAVAGLIAEINQDTETYEILESELAVAIAAWDGLSRSEYARDGQTTNSSLERVKYETRIVQDESGDFSDHAGDTTWIVADNVSTVRGFEMQVDEEALVETSDCTGSDTCFSLLVEGTDGESWRLYVYDDEGVHITVESSSGDTETYGPAETPAKLNITDGVFDVNGSDEAFTTFLDDELEGPYTLTYTNADNVNGTYELTVDGKIVEDTIEADDRYSVDETPKIEARIVAADVTLRYRSADLTYESEVEVVPGETHE